MFSILVALFAAVLGAGFWFDNAIVHPVLQFWWVPLIACYLILCIQLPESFHPIFHRVAIALTVGVLLLLSVWVFDDVITIYLTGSIFLIAWGIGCYAANKHADQARPVSRWLALIIALTLVILPVSVNRILITLPNLSAGTTITLHEKVGVTPDLDSRFHNRMNDKLEVETYLGTQVYFEQEHEAPKLEIETSLLDVVIRILSVSYQHRLAYLEMPLFELQGDDLLKISVADDGASVEMERDRVFLLLTGFKVGEPVWLQLPHMESHDLSLVNHAVVILFRLLLWLMICFAISVWLPRRNDWMSQSHAA